MSRGEEASEAKPVIERSRETLSRLPLHDKTTAPAATEIITMQHPDENAQWNVHSKEYDPELMLG
jgi:hypothetical protein